MLFLKVSFYQVRLALSVSQIASNVLNQFNFISRALPAHRITFDILIDHLVRVKLRAVAWQRDQLYFACLLTHPGFDSIASMHGMSVDDQEDRAIDLLDKPFQKIDKYRRRKSLRKHFEVHLSQI